MPRPLLTITIIVVAWFAFVAATSRNHAVANVPVLAAPQAPVRSDTPPRDPVGHPPAGSALIRGHVVALDTGQPLRGAQVTLGGAGISPSRTVMTDAQGQFEISGLGPGNYAMDARKPAYLGLSYGQRRPSDPRRRLELADDAVVDGVTFRLPRGGVIAGYVVDQYGSPVIGARVAVVPYVEGRAAAATAAGTGAPGTDDQGAFRLFGLPPGDYAVRATFPSPAITASDSIDSPRAYVPTYYPGTVFQESAQPIALRMSEQVTGLVVPIVAARTATVSGTVVDADRRPYPDVVLMLRDSTGSRDFGPSGPDGTFTVSGVPPGTYLVEARATRTARSAADIDVGAVDVIVTGEDVTGVLIAATAGVTVSGRIVDAAGGSPEGLRTTDVRIGTLPDPAGLTIGAGVVSLADDWTFELRHVQGRRLLRIGTPPEWSVRRIVHNGQDVTDVPLDFSRGVVDDLIVELTRDITFLSGTVLDAQGSPASDSVIVIFAEDPGRWRPPSRFVRTVRPDEQGSFETRGLPPGAYLVSAVESLGSGQASNPSTLERLRQSGGARRVSLRDGEASSVELRLLEGF